MLFALHARRPMGTAKASIFERKSAVARSHGRLFKVLLSEYDDKGIWNGISRTR